MPSYFERYQQGFCQEVYDELVAMQEAVFEEAVHQEAKLVAQEMMKRIRANIEMLIPRLKSLGYQFVDGDWTCYHYDQKQGKLTLSSQQDTLSKENIACCENHQLKLLLFCIKLSSY